MLRLDFVKRADSAYKVLCLGAHCDDIEIGCGGTILKLAERYKDALFYWAVLSSDQERAAEARTSANIFLEQARSKTVVIKNFRNGFFPYVGAEIKEWFEQLKGTFSPDLILTHYRNDLHQDHRVVSELTWNTFRDHLILEYEVPKYDADSGSPNVFVDLDQFIARKKITYLLNSFPSQKQKHWFDEETFSAILRLRGMESHSKYAEGFYSRKMVLELTS